MDLTLVITLVVAFALLVTTHVGLCVALARRRPRWRALVGLAIPPLVPYWSYREGWRAVSIFWIVACCVYVGSVVAAAR